MSREIHRCEICVRLGKKQCGYHRFKQEYLSKISTSHQKQGIFAQTKSSINRILSSPFKSQRQIAFTPEKQNRQQIKIQYINSQKPIQYGIQSKYASTPQQQNRYMPQNQSRSTITHSRQIPVLSRNNVSKVIENQVLYYPIYPVYQVVYQPVTNNSSYISTPSRVIYQ